MKKSIVKLAIVAVAACSLAVVSAGTAAAATTVNINAFDQLDVQAASGVNNYINVYPGGGLSNYYQVIDSNDTVTPGAGCVADSANSVTCGPVLDWITVDSYDGDDYVSGYYVYLNRFSADGGDGADTVTGAGSANNILHGGPGNDTVTGGDGYDSITGGSGDDTITGKNAEDNLWGESGADTIHGGGAVDMIDGGSENDTLNGNGGSDSIYGGSGADILNGGDDDDILQGGLDADQINGDAGIDQATYAEKTASVNVQIDGSANDGTSGEQDNVSTTTENLLGTGFGDQLRAPTTGTTANRIEGGAGSDTIYGYGGSDTLIGGTGFDLHYGGAGNDQINSKDSLNDLVDCGADTDTLNADLSPLDSMVSNCETVNRS